MLGIACIFAVSRLSAQTGDAVQLQERGTVELDRWSDYARRTGDANSTRADLIAARADLASSTQIFLQKPDYAGAALSAVRLGVVLRLLEQGQDADKILTAAVEMARRAQRTDLQTYALSELAYLELQRGDVQSADKNARDAVSVGATCGNKTYYFEALNTAADVSLKRGDFAGASDELNRALEMSAQVDPKKVYFAYMDRGSLYEEKAKCDNSRNYDICLEAVDLARKDYENAKDVAQKLGYTYFVKLFDGMISNLLARQKLLESARGTDQTIGNTQVFHPRVAKDVLVSERFSVGAADPSVVAVVEAAIRQMRAEQASLQQSGVLSKDVNPTDVCLEGQYQEMKGANDASLRAYAHGADLLEQDRRKLTDEHARSNLLNDKLTCFYRPALLYLDKKQFAEAFALFERSRSRAMADMLSGQKLNLRDEHERALYANLQSMQSSISAKQRNLFALTSDSKRQEHIAQISELESQIDGLQKQYGELQSRIAQQAPHLNQLTTSQPTTLAAMQRAAAAGGYDVLYYVVIEEGIVVWHIDGSRVQVKNVFLPQAQLVKKAGALRDSLVAPATGSPTHFDEDMAHQLFLYLIQPVLSSIATHNLVIIPHEELNAIPFQALLDPQSGKYLGESYAISYAPSATVFVTLQAHPHLRNGSLLAVSDPAIHQSELEVSAIGKLYPGRSNIVTQRQSTKSDVEGWVPSFNIVHLSVHGRFNKSDPLLSYLQFKESGSDDGRLTAAEMFGLPLRDNSVVVLSACETGRIDATRSNEVLGMVRSLLYAGAGTLVLSSWEVNAGSTRLWMETFYREAQNNPPPEAARRALLAVKARPEFAHPFYWAPFLMTGH